MGNIYFCLLVWQDYVTHARLMLQRVTSEINWNVNVRINNINNNSKTSVWIVSFTLAMLCSKDCVLLPLTRDI